MSPDDIIETIKYYISNCPKNGDTLDSVKSRILVEPISYIHDDVYKFIEAKFDSSNSPIIKDSISQISYDHCYLEMDGITIGVLNNSCNIDITLNIVDYDKAEKLFDGLASYFDSVCKGELSIDKEGSGWRFNFDKQSMGFISLDEDDKVSTNTINEITSLSVKMNRIDGGYRFVISVDIRNS